MPPFFILIILSGAIFAYIVANFTGMEVCINITPGSQISNEEIIDLLKLILNKQSTIMAAIDDLKAQVDALQAQATDLQTALDAEQAQIQQLLDNNANVVNSLNQQIAALQQEIANGASPEQLQSLAGGITQISQQLATTKADLESTVTDAPQTGGEGTNTGSGDTQAQA